MNLAIQAHPQDAAVIAELLSPWNAAFTELDRAEVAIVYKQKPPDQKNSVIIPSDTEEFRSWVGKVQVNANNNSEKPKLVFAKTPQTTLTAKPKTLYSCADTARSFSDADGSGVEFEVNGNLVLGVDVVCEYNQFFNETLNARQSRLYRLCTGLPIPYGLAPKQVRDFLMKDRGENGYLTLCNKLQIDVLRLILVQAVSGLSGTKLQRKGWSGQGFACVLTHDIEDYEGLERAPHVKKLEEKYDLPSAWFIPSSRYKLRDGIVKTLTHFGEVGSHDTKHDGKLATLSKDQLVERLSDAKYALGAAADAVINGFRAPLLQHNFQILQALAESGYVYDASIPAWEPKHPYTMKPHGIGTLFPFHVNGFPEVPLTLPQDHQMLHALGLPPKQTVDAWARLMEEAKAAGGMCVFLTHPNELANQENEGAYEDLLSIIACQRDASVMLPKAVAESLNEGNKTDFW